MANQAVRFPLRVCKNVNAVEDFAGTKLLRTEHDNGSAEQRRFLHWVVDSLNYARKMECEAEDRGG